MARFDSELEQTKPGPGKHCRWGQWLERLAKGIPNTLIQTTRTLQTNQEPTALFAFFQMPGERPLRASSR